MKYYVFIHKYCDRTITANYGGYFYSMASEKEQLYLRLCASYYATFPAEGKQKAQKMLTKCGIV